MNAIEIIKADGSVFSEESLDGFIRYQNVEKVYSIENGKLIRKNNGFVDDWSIERKREKAREILSGRYVTYCAFLDGRVIGEIMLVPELNKGRLIIDSFHVSEDMRRHGCGRLLFQKALDHAKSRGARGIYVSSSPAAETVDFYTAMGFAPSKDIIGSYAEDEPSDIQMEYLIEG